MAAIPFASLARAQSLVATDLGVAPGVTDDQSRPLQDALLRAAEEGRPLFLPAGTYFVQNLHVPSRLVLSGVPGATMLAAAADAPIVRVAGSAHVRFQDIGFGAGNGGPTAKGAGLVEIETSDNITLENCSFMGGHSNGLAVRDAAAEIISCDFSGHGQAGIFSLNSRGLRLSGNRIDQCSNGGILIWGSENRHDGSVVSGNFIQGVGFKDGGNGQNGNGINVFRCDDVILSHNQIADCAFSAIRLNSTNNAIVNSNLCRNSGEVAIFSEFAFSGSVIANNIVDGAAQGISITNLDSGGHLATCSGNVVRNIRPKSEVNPDTRPVGIYAEAETAVTGNTVEGVPGIGILAGWGPYLRNVVVADNVIRSVETGIGVSVVESDAPRAVSITGNVIAPPVAKAIVGMAWQDVVSDDLVRDAAKYPYISLSGNKSG